MVTTQGFNALLKVVEEPPEFLVFVFATTEPDKVLPTIRSRTHHYPFRLVPPTTLRGLLEKTCDAEGVTVEPTVFPLVVRAGGGSVRDSLSILDQLLAGAGPEGVTYRSAVGLLGVTDDALLDETIDALAAHDAPGRLPRGRPRRRGRARPTTVRHRPARPAARPDRPRRRAGRRWQRAARLPARPARPDEPAGPGAGLGDAVADGRHRARRADRDAGDDGAAAAARARLRPDAPARDRRRRPSRPSSGSSASSGGCPSRASTPAGRSPSPRPGRPLPRPVAEPPAREAAPRPAPAAAAPPPVREAAPPPAPAARPDPEAAAGARKEYVRPSQRSEAAAPAPAARRRGRRRTGRRRLAGDGAAGLRGGTVRRRPGARRAEARRSRARRAAACASRDGVRAGHPAAAGAHRRRGLAAPRPPRRRRGRGRADGRAATGNGAAPAGSPPRAAAESSPVPRGGEPTPVVSANPEPAAADGELTTTDVRRVWPELLSRRQAAQADDRGAAQERAGAPAGATAS